MARAELLSFLAPWDFHPRSRSALVLLLLLLLLLLRGVALSLAMERAVGDPGYDDDVLRRRQIDGVG
jgi:hypothetical protein